MTDLTQVRTESIKKDIEEAGFQALKNHFSGGWQQQRANTQNALMSLYGGPKRRENESREEYKARRKLMNQIERGILKGTPVSGL